MMLSNGESAKVGLRNLSITSVTPGIWTSPPNRAPSPSTAIADLIGQSRSAMWCSAPGNPTSVSSFSPLSGVAGGEEQKRLEEGVGHQVEEPRRVGADRDGDGHVADLANRRVGDDPLQVGDRERAGGGEDQRRETDERRDIGSGGGEHEQRMGP